MKHLIRCNFANFGFALAVVIIFGISGYVVINLRTFIRSTNLVEHTLIVMNHLNRTLALLNDAEMVQRVYIITGDAKFLEPCHAACAQEHGINQILHELRQLTSDKPNQQQRLDILEPLVEKRLDRLEQGIALRQNKGFEVVRQFIGPGKTIVNKIRSLVAEMESEERGLLQQRTDAASVNLKNTILSLVIAVLAIVALLLLSFYIVNREVLIRYRAEAKLQQVNDELELRVQERTSELTQTNEELKAEIAIRNRAEEEVKRQFRHLHALREIDLAIMGSTDIYLSLKTIIEQLLSNLEVDAADFLLFNPHTQRFKYVIGRGFRSKNIEKSEFKIEQGILGRAVLEQKVQHVINLPSSEEFERASLLADEDFIEYYAVPLIINGEVNGILEIFHRRTLAFNESCIDLLHSLAGQAAIAIENNRLFKATQRANVELLQAYDSTIEGWSRALDLRDKETEGHSLRVTEMTMKLAQITGINEEELIDVQRGALLHDIGKMGVPDHILLKPGKLTDEEWVIMCKHPTFAYELLSPITYLRNALDIPYCHHEKWDGTGYPRGLKGEQIPLPARLFAIVDVWDALHSDRPYRKAWSEEKVYKHIKSLVGTHFEPKAAESFFEMMSQDTKDAG
jgi:HD-GYP domain-containing protein (c-di-GMP phosphodiesterase class II)/CHASE3 domain sensor protein